MKKLNSAAAITILLVIFSMLIFVIQIIIFKTPRDTGFYFMQDMGFLPLQVAIVTVIIGRILNDREKRERLKKTNMMLGSFFSEIGNEMLLRLSAMKTNSGEFKKELEIKESWSSRDFRKAAAAIEGHDLSLFCTAEDFQSLKEFLSEKRSFMLLMLTNPNLHEHESFTDLLWAVFHLADELSARDGFYGLPESDTAHLNNDAKRAYDAILSVWVIYMGHLKTNYPYLFSLEMRRNPFAGEGGVVIR